MEENQDQSNVSEAVLTEIEQRVEGIKQYHQQLFEGDGEQKSIQQEIASYKGTAEKLHDEVVDYHDELLVDDENNCIKTEIANYRDELLTDVGDKKSIKTQITALQADVKKQAEAVDEYHDLLFVDDDKGESRKTEIETYYKELLGDDKDTPSIKKQVAETHATATKQAGEISTYHANLLTDAEDRKSTKSEIEQYIKDTKQSFDDLYKQLKHQIEELLPTAAAAGLAFSYKGARDDYLDKKKTRFFYAAFLLPLVVYLLIYFCPTDFLKNLEASVVEGKVEYTALILFRVLIGAPLFAISLFGFYSIRINRRMAEEYNHKQRVMELYSGFKKEIEAQTISMNSPEEALALKNRLLSIMLKTVAQQPSRAMKDIDRGLWSEVIAALSGGRNKAGRSQKPDEDI